MDINVNISAPELAAALESMAAALRMVAPQVATAPVQEVPATKATEKVTESAEKVTEKPQKATKNEETAPETPEKETKPAKEIKLEEVRAKLAAISQSGKQAEVKELIQSFGVAKLTDIPEENYAEVLEKAEDL